MTTPQPQEQGETAPIELPGHPPAQSPPVEATPEPRPVEPAPAVEPAPSFLSEAPSVPIVARPVEPAEREVTFVPLAVTIGDGFKFGCGFFLAMVIAALVAFVLLAVLFVLTGLLGLNLPLSR